MGTNERFILKSRKDMDILEIDFSYLDDKSRHQLHRSLYRQECRAFLLWISLACLLSINFIPISRKEVFSWENELIWFVVIVYLFYLSFWVISPTQKILTTLRKNTNTI
jgi:hypothetical protein